MVDLDHLLNLQEVKARIGIYRHWHLCHTTKRSFFRWRFAKERSQRTGKLRLIRARLASYALDQHLDILSPACEREARKADNVGVEIRLCCRHVWRSSYASFKSPLKWTKFQ